MHIGRWEITTKDWVWFSVCLFVVLFFCVGIAMYDQEMVPAVLSSAATSASIVLSIVAIIYTMLEGANSAKVNQDSQNKLNGIENTLKNVTDRLNEYKGLEQKIKGIVPKLDTAYQQIEQSTPDGSQSIIKEEIKKEIEYLMTYINEDIED